ncbi:ABC transporter permease [Candidatus Riflebacteria bacterium]
MAGIKEKLIIISRNPRAFFGFIVLVFFFLMATIGPFLVPLDMKANYLKRFQSPSRMHLLGTDYAGRDTFSQIVHGSTDVMLIAFSTAFFGTALAIILGFTAGLLGGWIDRFIIIVVDVVLTVPSFPVMAIFAALFKIHDPISFGLILSLWTWPGLARALRNQVVAINKKEFVEVCFVMDLPLSHIIMHELLPNMIPYIAINFINIAKGAITASVGIMLLGLVPLSVTNWGMMLNMATTQTGAIYVPSAFAYILSPVFFIVLFQFSLICFAAGIEEMFDPRLR